MLDSDSTFTNPTSVLDHFHLIFIMSLILLCLSVSKIIKRQNKQHLTSRYKQYFIMQISNISGLATKVIKLHSILINYYTKRSRRVHCHSTFMALLGLIAPFASAPDDNKQALQLNGWRTVLWDLQTPLYI